MNSTSLTPSFEHWRAADPAPPARHLVDPITRQLRQIGVAADVLWPDLPADFDAAGYDILFFDADMGHDCQFPWGRGAVPDAVVALIGSEAPGRIAWAIRRGADAHLLKPIGSGGIYSAMLIASHAFKQRGRLQRRDRRAAPAPVAARGAGRGHRHASWSARTSPPRQAYKAAAADWRWPSASPSRRWPHA